MWKIILGFAMVIGFTAQVFAIEVEIVAANEPEEESSQPWVITIDGKTEVNATVFGKIIACHEKFTPQNKVIFNDVFEHSGGIAELKERHKSMKRTPASTRQLTLSNRELSQTFVETTLKDCLSK